MHYVRAREIETIKSELPELTYRQEILAEFLEGEGAIFRKISSSIIGSLGVAEPERLYSLGADLAKTQDFTVLTALDDRGHIRGFERFRARDSGWTPIDPGDALFLEHGLRTVEDLFVYVIGRYSQGEFNHWHYGFSYSEAGKSGCARAMTRKTHTEAINEFLSILRDTKTFTFLG